LREEDVIWMLYGVFDYVFLLNCALDF
jgi:hypothetical protein